MNKLAKYIILFLITYIPTLNYELEHLSWYAQDRLNGRTLRTAMKAIIKHTLISEVEIAYARHLLRRNPAIKKPLIF